MTNPADNVTVVAVAETRREGPPEDPTRRKDHRAEARPAPLDRSVYLHAARASLPRWLQILGPAPWFDSGRRLPSISRGCASVLYRRQSATLAIALLYELDRQQPDRDYLRECVRASLTRWQMSLRGDGRPAHRGQRHSPLHAATLWSVVQLLSETSGFQTHLLLKDIERHLNWLTRRNPHTPWIEAATIGAMTDGALLVRDAGLLKQARERLVALLARQDEEGWFPQRGGADIGGLSLTVDALARVYRQNQWGELELPLERALGFLSHFVHPDGSVGGCYGTCETAFISPFGVELLAPTFAEAATLALICRRRCAEAAAYQLCGYDNDQCAMLGASVALAAATAEPRLREGCADPHRRCRRMRFPHAGLTIFDTDAYYAVVAGKKGGAIRVTWRNGAAGLNDPGVSVICAHAIKTSTQPDRRTREDVTDVSVTSSGILRRTEPARIGPGARLKRWIAGLGRGQSPDDVRLTAALTTGGRHECRSPNERPPRIDYQRLTHDRYTREITLGDDWIRIRDHVHCRLPCQTILCQSAPPTRSGPFGDPIGSYTNHPPIFIDGGRSVGITRVYRNGLLVDQTNDQPLIHIP